MKNYTFAFAAALMSIILAAPSLAGSTDARGGKSAYSLDKYERKETSGSRIGVYGSVSRTLCQTGAAAEACFGAAVLGSANPSAADKFIAEYAESGRSFVIPGRETYHARHGAGSMEGVVIKGTEEAAAVVASRSRGNSSSARREEKSAELVFVDDMDNIPAAYAAGGALQAGDADGVDCRGVTKVFYQLNTAGIVSPIVLDLDGDGRIGASGGRYLPHEGDFSKNAVMFDFYGNGFPVVCEWVDGGDGLLCRPNGDGSVNGTNLFGTANGYADGFEELSVLDADGSGALEGTELSELMVWVDGNGNAAADAGELKTLGSLGITSIGVRHNNMVGFYVRQGRTFRMYDWWPSIADCRKVGLTAWGK